MGCSLITPESIAERDKSEQGQQTALFCWAALAAPEYPDLKMMFAVPNGGTRHKVEAMRLKASGVRAGVPDIILAAPRQGYHALFVELKVGRNNPSPEQVAWMRELSGRNYLCIVCYTFEAARNQIISYLKEK